MSKVAFSRNAQISKWCNQVFANQYTADQAVQENAIESENDFSICSLEDSLESRDNKNNHLLNMLNEYFNCDREELKNNCLKHLQIVSKIVNANGDWDSLLLEGKLSQEFANADELKQWNDILLLFQNRRSKYFGEQNVTRTGAKYTAVLIKTLCVFYSQDELAQLFSKNQINKANIESILTEANKWYRGNYIKNVDVTIDLGGYLRVTLGKPNGTMGSNYRISFPDYKILPNSVYEILKISNQDKNNGLYSVCKVINGAKSYVAYKSQENDIWHAAMFAEKNSNDKLITILDYLEFFGPNIFSQVNSSSNKNKESGLLQRYIMVYQNIDPTNYEVGLCLLYNGSMQFHTARINSAKLKSGNIICIDSRKYMEKVKGGDIVEKECDPEIIDNLIKSYNDNFTRELFKMLGE